MTSSRRWQFRTLLLLVVATLVACSLAVSPRADAAGAGFVGGAVDPVRNGHWMVSPKGQVATNGESRFFGDLRAVALNKPVVGMAATATGNGYWLVASDGGIFAYGDARFYGSTGSIALNKPVVGMAATATGNGYWLVASDGGIFAYGDARFYGSTGSIALNKPITAMSATESANGYWLVASDGGIFAFGDAPFLGSGANSAGPSAVAIVRSGGGYAMVREDGSVMRAEPPDLSLGGEPVVQPPVDSSAPAGVPGQWNLRFQDHFDGASLDRGKWGTCYIWATHGCTNAGNNELEWYLPENVSQAEGKLNLTAKRQTVTGLGGKQFDYTSGMVTTGPHQPTSSPAKYEFTYGYVEARVKVPRGKALWPAVWLLPSTGHWPPEIDVMEILGDDTTDAHLTVHWSEDGRHRSSGGGYRGPDFAADYHTFGVDWQPDKLTWYVDGVARREFTNAAAIPDEPMYVLLNLAVGGDWPGAPDATTPFPSTFQVDHVKVWQRV